jgi:phosphatidylglycerol---prolipoprotein diacylglyceryl transferase
MVLNYITWNIDPVLFKIGSASVYWYSIFLALSFYISFRLMMLIYESENKSKETLLSYGLFILAGLILGGRLMHCLAYEPEYYLKYPLDIIRPWRGELGTNARFVGYRGMSGHGSALGIILGIVINALRTRTSLVWMVDRIAIFGPLIGFFVRLGNFFNSEILGKPSDSPMAVLFARKDHIPRHPVQLYEAITYLIIFIISYKYYKKVTGYEKPGAILGLVLILVYSARFLLEFFKAKQADIESGLTMNMGHLLSIPFIIAGLVLFFRPEKKMNRIQNDKSI